MSKKDKAKTWIVYESEIRKLWDEETNFYKNLYKNYENYRRLAIEMIKEKNLEYFNDLAEEFPKDSRVGI